MRRLGGRRLIATANSFIGIADWVARPAPRTMVSMQQEESGAPAREDTATAFEPLRLPVFRTLWLAWLMANTIMWMNDVAAAWLMTSLATSALWVALVSAAATLPVFVLGLPSGALADMLDRRRYFMATQWWVAAIACVTGIAVVAGWMTAPLLLVLTFANGMGMAMRWPVFAAIVPEIVPRPHLPQALALNSVAMNGSRILGPLLAGAVIAAAGSQWVFVFNAAFSIVAGWLIMRWPREEDRELRSRTCQDLVSAIGVGLRFVRSSPAMRSVLLRIALFFLHSTGLVALMPVVARGLPGGTARTFTLLLACMGAGAILAALQMPRIRHVVTARHLILYGTVLQALGMLAVAHAPSLSVALPALFISGLGWFSVANSLTLSAQAALPDWVRARGMSIYQMSLMGAMAGGAALWGQVAAWTSVQDSLSIASASAVLLMVLADRHVSAR
jgi:MFS family permease